MSNAEWTEVISLKNTPFSGNSGLRVDVLDDSTYRFFNLIITDELLQHIIEETNRCAEEVFLSEKTAEKSRITTWKPFTLSEIKVFFALLLHMGHIQIQRTQDY